MPLHLPQQSVIVLNLIVETILHIDETLHAAFEQAPLLDEDIAAFLHGRVSLL